jgi:hypothetical protein
VALKGIPSTTSADLRFRRQERLKERFNIIDSGIKLTIAIIIVLATELTIQWNHINGVYSIGPAGQTIPLVLGIAAVAVVVYKAFKEGVSEEHLSQRAVSFAWVAVANSAADGYT